MRMLTNTTAMIAEVSIENKLVFTLTNMNPKGSKRRRNENLKKFALTCRFFGSAKVCNSVGFR